jgi:type IV secretory pathway VirB10-like protein
MTEASKKTFFSGIIKFARQNVKFSIGVGAVVLLTGIMTAYAFVASSKPDPRPDLALKTVKREIPAVEVWSAFNKKQEEVKLLNETKEPEKLQAKNLFIAPSRQENPFYRHMLQRRIAAVNDRSRRGGGVYVRDAQSNNFVNISYRRNKSKPPLTKNHAANQEPTIMATYPADLSRLLLMNEFVPAILITEIKSELGSQSVQSLVQEDVFSFHGKNILVPKGTRAFGCYVPLDNNGATRLAIRWFRLVRPDGIDIRLMDGEGGGSDNCNGFGGTADLEGSSGLTGRVDKKLDEKYLDALLVSLINVAAQMNVEVDNEKQVAIADAVANPVSEVTANILRENISIMRTIRIPKGEKFFIQPTADIYFREPINKTILATRTKTGDNR